MVHGERCTRTLPGPTTGTAADGLPAQEATGGTMPAADAELKLGAARAEEVPTAK